jgi:hypothetical protein
VEEDTEFQEGDEVAQAEVVEWAGEGVESEGVVEDSRTAVGSQGEGEETR